jgi:formylglycine-generating enzyme
MFARCQPFTGGTADTGLDANGDTRVFATDAEGDANEPDGGVQDATLAERSTSCAGGGGLGLSNCGFSKSESCCASPLVDSGTFVRSFDDVKNAPGSLATVSSFRLDRFEVTVGRFRKFVTASIDGWVPPAGSGKHTHLNAGKGLAEDAPSKFEPGWDSGWNSSLATTAAKWNNDLACNAQLKTWTDKVGGNEGHPIVCETWFEAAAFCIWDGGFLPSEAEWNYAAAGGAEQRVYPWSTPAKSTAIDCSYANYEMCSDATVVPVGQLPKGDSKWGHADLAGNAWEWTLDWKQDYTTPCIDCATVTFGTERVIRGGGFKTNTDNLEAARRNVLAPLKRFNNTGFRCARMP